MMTSGIAGSAEHLRQAAYTRAHGVSLELQPPIGAEAGANGRMISGDQGGQNACGFPGALTGQSPGDGQGTNPMPWGPEDNACNVNPGGGGRKPGPQAGGTCSCSCVMEPRQKQAAQ